MNTEGMEAEAFNEHVKSSLDDAANKAFDTLIAQGRDSLIKKCLSELITEAFEATQRGDAFVFCDYYGHVNGVTVDAQPTTQIYKKEIKHEHLFTYRIDLNQPTALSEMKRALEAIRSLGDQS